MYSFFVIFYGFLYFIDLSMVMGGSDDDGNDGTDTTERTDEKYSFKVSDSVDHGTTRLCTPTVKSCWIAASTDPKPEEGFSPKQVFSN